MRKGKLLTEKKCDPSVEKLIINQPVKAGFIPIIMNKHFTLLSLLAIFFVGTVFAQIPDAPITKIGKVVVATPYPAYVDVDITVQNFANIGSISLVLTYDKLLMDYSNVSFIHSAINGLSSGENSSGGELSFAWSSLSTINLLPDETVLFTIRFINYTGGTALIKWLDNPDHYCEYSGPSGAYNDSPTEDFYKDGYVTDIDATVSSLVTVCNNPNYGEISISATGGSGNFIYKIDDGTPVTNTTGTFTNLPSGTYEVSIIDANFPLVELVLDPALFLDVPTVNGYLYNPRLSTYYCYINDAVTAAADGDEIQFVYPFTYDSYVYNDPTKAIDFVDMTGGGVLFEGISSAFHLIDGNISFTGVKFNSVTNNPTILVDGGVLKLRDNIITEAAGFNQSSILVNGGELDAGKPGDPGKNIITTDGPGKLIANGGSIQANALCNFYGTVDYTFIATNITGDVVYDPWNDATLNNCIYSQYGGPITYAGKVIAPVGNVVVPITVENFNNIDAISLTFNFDGTALSYNGISDFDSDLFNAGGSPTVVVSGNTFTFGWNASTAVSAAGGVTLPGPGEKLLFNIQFTSISGTYPLVWDNSLDHLCDYRNALIAGPYIDEPTPDFYKDGFVSDIGGAVTAFTHEVCYGDEDGTIIITANGGSFPNYIYKINDGTTVTNTSGYFTGVAPGTYTASVIDGNYPWVEYIIIPDVTILRAPSPLVSKAHESHTVQCKGESNGQITVISSGGWGGITHSIDGVNYTATKFFDGLPVGEYTVFTKDSYGCIITETIKVTEPLIPLSASGVESKVVTCKGGADGEATLAGHDGWMNDYRYSKDGLNYQQSPVITGLSAGDNTLYVKDDGNCVKTVIVTINEPTIALSATAVASKMASCWGYNDGEITVTPVGGWGSYEYSSDNITWQTSNVLVGFSAGTHTIYVRDLQGCVVAANDVVITEPDHIYGDITGTTTICSGESATVYFTMNGGTPPYTLEYLQPGGTVQTITTMDQTHSFTQNYTASTSWDLVSLTDANGCTSTLSGNVVITVNPLPVVTDLVLESTKDLTTWTPLGGSLNGGFTMCVDPTLPYQYLGIASLTVGPNQLGTTSFVNNRFYLDNTNLPAGYMAYWAAQGVVSGAAGWQGIMWDIINGVEPMFYVNYDGTDYTLIDGLQYLNSGAVNPLRISGDYPAGDYTYHGTIIDINGCAAQPFDVNITFNSSPVVVGLELQESEDQANWNPIAGTLNDGFEMCVDQMAQYHYLDIASINIVGNSLLSTSFTQNGFYIDVNSLPAGFYADWAAAGVVAGAAGWQGVMWDIINGIEPMFYVNYDGTDYTLVDGLQYLHGSGVFPLRVAGDMLLGTYKYIGTLTDINGCPSSPVTVQMTFKNKPMISFGFNGVEAGHNPILKYCYDTPVEVTLYKEYAGVAPYSVTFEVDGVTSTVTNLYEGDIIVPSQIFAPGTYSVVVTNITDSEGCDAGQAFLDLCAATVIVGAEPFIGLAFNGELAATESVFEYCANDIIEVTLDKIWAGEAPFDIEWTVDGVPATSTMTNLNDALFTGTMAAGLYSIQITSITDAIGCSPSDYTPYICTVIVNPEPAIGFSFNNNLATTGSTIEYCEGETVEVTLSHVWAGSAPFEIEWMVDGANVTSTVAELNDVIFTGILPVGIYHVEVTSITDAEGCSPSDYTPYEMYVEVYPLPTVTIPANVNACSGGQFVDVPYAGETNDPDLYYVVFDAAAALEGFVDSSPVSLTSGTLAAPVSPTAPAGVYNASLFVVNSVTGCVSLAIPFTITLPDAYTVTATYTNVTCNGADDGTASVAVAGSWGGYTYLWDDPAGQTTSTAVDLAPGVYTVVVFDAEGCTTTATFTITEPEILDADIVAEDVTCHAADNGKIIITDPTGGYGTYEFSIDGITWQSAPLFENLAPGTYTVEIRDAIHASCTIVLGSLTITEPDPISVSGKFAYHNLYNTPLNNITVEFYDGTGLKYTTVTDAYGNYTFPNVCPSSYEVVCSTIKSTFGSINSTDAVQVHAWGPAPNQIEMVKFLAGDVNLSNLISQTDALHIVAHFLSTETKGFDRDPWTFWIKNDPISVNSYSGGQYPIITIGSTDLTQDFYGLATGDFNNSFVPGNAKGANKVSCSNNNVKYTDCSAEILLPVNIETDIKVSAISLSLNYPVDKVEVLDVFFGTDLSTRASFIAENGDLIISYHNINPQFIANGHAMLTLRLKPLAGLVAGESVKIVLANDPRNEIADENYQGLPSAQINIPVIEGVVYVPELTFNEEFVLANYPNPFSSTTTFNFTIPVEGKVNFVLYDATGRVVKNIISEQMTSGVYTVTLDEALNAGIYNAVLSLEAPEGSAVRTIRVTKTK